MKQSRRPAGVLSRDEGDLAENSEGAQRDIFEVADRSGDHIQDAGHARGADSTRMYSAEPLPHFVDEYLAWLHETHPTNATFDGVHLHDDLLEDLSRAAIDAQVRDLGGFARRLAAIDPSRLTDIERLERPALDASIRARLFELETVRTWERNPQSYGDLVSTSLAGQVLFDYAPLPERARRVLSKLHQVPRLMQAARDNIKDPPGIFIKVGLESLRGTLRFIESDLPRAFGGLHDMRVLGDLADASTEAAQAIGSYIAYLENDLAPRARGTFRLGRDVFEQKLRLDEGITLDADRLLAIATRELHATQEEFRKVASRLDPKQKDPFAAWARAKTDHPPLGQVVATAQAQLDELKTFIQRQDIVSLPGSAEVQVAPTPRFYRWTFASMWTPGPFETRPLRAYYYITDADPSWPADRQEEHLRDFNCRRAVGDLHPRGLPGALPPLPAPAPGVGDAEKVDPLLVHRDGRGLGALLGTDDDGGRVPQAGPGGPPRPARRSADPSVPPDRRHPAALRRSVGRTRGPALPRRGLSRGGLGAPRSRARHL